MFSNNEKTIKNYIICLKNKDALLVVVDGARIMSLS